MPYLAPKVDAGAFTAYDSPYAQALAAASQQAGPRGYLSMAALGNKVGSGQENYLKAMQDANANQLAGSDAENQAEMAKALLTYLPSAADKGIASAVDIGQNRYLSTNQPHLAQSDVVHLNNTDAGAFKARADGIVGLAGVNMAPPMEQVSQGLRSPLSGPDDPYLNFGNYLTNDDKVANEKLEIDRMDAGSRRISANKPSGGDGGGNVTYTYEGMMPGGVTKTVKSKTPMDPNGLGFVPSPAITTPGVGGGRAGPAGGTSGVRVLGPNKPTKPAPPGKRYGYNKTTRNYYEYDVGQR